MFLVLLYVATAEKLYVAHENLRFSKDVPVARKRSFTISLSSALIDFLITVSSFVIIDFTLLSKK